MKKIKQLSKPHNCYIILTADCNMRCMHCYGDYGVDVPEEELSGEEWKKVIQDLENSGVFYVNISGGEPIFSDNEITNDENILVLSIFVDNTTCYLGVSTADENLNFHSDDHRICSKQGRTISRAENKLIEALAKFNIKLNGKGIALDIGASPGGWSKVLADYGYEVLAVDPGMLKEELYQNPNIKHIKDRIENVEIVDPLDIIVNDMNVDPEITAEMMNKLSVLLKDKGLAVLTIKLPYSPRKGIQNAVTILEECYEIKDIKNLFHNRQEVTALLQKKIAI